jgi:hypothetical protein
VSTQQTERAVLETKSYTGEIAKSIARYGAQFGVDPNTDKSFNDMHAALELASPIFGKILEAAGIQLGAEALEAVNGFLTSPTLLTA